MLLYDVGARVVALLSFVSGVRAARTYQARLDTTTPISRVSSRFCSFTIGASVVRRRWVTFDFQNERLKTLARGLRPAYLRLGGTSAQYMNFDPNGKGKLNPKFALKGALRKGQAPPVDENVYEDEESLTSKHTQYNMTGEDFRNINTFAKNAGWKFLFNFNILQRKDGKWDPTNAKEILDFSVKHGYTRNQIFELGNEPNTMHLKHGSEYIIPAETLADDYKRLRRILNSRRYARLFRKKMLLVGPDITKGKSGIPYLKSFLQRVGKDLDAVTWHHYYLDSSTARLEQFTDPHVLDSLLPYIRNTRAAVLRFMPENTKIWFGETGSCHGGGKKGLSNRYVAGFLFLDKLGLAAKHGMDVVLRQSFYSGQYAMIDRNLYPFPDYWLALVYKVLVGSEVLNVTLSKPSRHLRLYAHCTNSVRSRYAAGAVTVFGMNVYEEEVKLQLATPSGGQRTDVYLLTPGHGGLTSRNVTINGEPMKMVDDKTLPKISPVHVAAGKRIAFPPKTFGFFVLPDAKAAACGYKEENTFTDFFSSFFGKRNLN